jgi:outer membrane protein assembly factor BamB
MSQYFRTAALLSLGCSLAWSSNWLTYGGDPQRDGWAKDETVINKENVHGLELGWKIQLDNEAKELNSLMAPLILDGIVTSHGFKEYVFVAGSGDNLYAIDADTGKLVWKKHFASNATPPKQPAQNWLCPNALNDTPIISKGFTNSSVYVISTDGKLHALNPVNGEDRFPPAQFVPPYSKNWSLNFSGNVLYTSTSQ